MRAFPGAALAALLVAAAPAHAQAPIDLETPFGIALGQPLPAGVATADAQTFEGEVITTLEAAPAPGEAFSAMSFSSVADSASGNVRSVIASGTTPETMDCARLRGVYEAMVAATPGAVVKDRRQVSPGKTQAFDGWTRFVQIDTDGTETAGEGGVLIAGGRRLEIMAACDLFSGITVSLAE